MMSDLFYGWLILALLFLICEIGHPGLFFFLSFCIGALGAGFTALISDSVVLQSLLFLLCSLLSGFVLIIFCKKRMKHSYQATNVQALIGNHALVIKTINPEQPGQVKVGGEIWSARSINNEIIEKDVVVEVIIIRGVHVFVRKI